MVLFMEQRGHGVALAQWFLTLAFKRIVRPRRVLQCGPLALDLQRRDEGTWEEHRPQE